MKTINFFILLPIFMAVSFLLFIITSTLSVLNFVIARIDVFINSSIDDIYEKWKGRNDEKK